MRKRTRTLKTVAGLVLSVSLSGCLNMGSSTEESSSVVPIPPPPPSGNVAPSISGQPQAAVSVGGAYSFTPTASDADGDPLTFSVQNLPRWATFDSSSGQLSGQPGLGDIGSFSNIVISVSDGTSSDSLPQFSIDVTQASLGSATLSWTAPTTNDDGTTLSDLSGYKIYFGTTVGSYPNQYRIDNPGLSQYVIENLVPDTYYFVATAINSSGYESGFSNVASVTVN